MSARETAITALHSRLVTSLAARNPAPVVLRGETTPQRIPAGGLVIVRDGEAVEETPILSPLAWHVEFEGAAAARATSVPVTLWFTVAGSPLA